MLDIYATSVDYDPLAEASPRFFQVVQNKMHWAAHGRTAAEVIAQRADVSQPNMGLTTWASAGTGGRVKRSDVSVAYRAMEDRKPQPVDSAFDEAVEKTKKLGKPSKKG